MHCLYYFSPPGVGKKLYMLHTFLQTDYTGQMLRNSLAKSCQEMPTLCSVENLLLLV